MRRVAAQDVNIPRRGRPRTEVDGADTGIDRESQVAGLETAVPT
jgi:hypothetical protein